MSCKSDEINNRILQCADYYILHSSTIRKTANVFNISKSTLHANFQKHLKYLDIDKYNKVRKVIDINVKERAYRGAIASNLLRQK